MKIARILIGVVALCGSLLIAAEKASKPDRLIEISVAVTGTAPFTYQWKKDSVDIPGATAATLVMTQVQFADAGVYSVQVTNSAGSILSDNATLTISTVDAPPNPRRSVPSAAL